MLFLLLLLLDDAAEQILLILKALPNPTCTRIVARRFVEPSPTIEDQSGSLPSPAPEPTGTCLDDLQTTMIIIAASGAEKGPCKVAGVCFVCVCVCVFVGLCEVV